MLVRATVQNASESAEYTCVNLWLAPRSIVTPHHGHLASAVHLCWHATSLFHRYIVTHYTRRAYGCSPTWNLALSSEAQGPPRIACTRAQRRAVGAARGSLVITQYKILYTVYCIPAARGSLVITPLSRLAHVVWTRQGCLGEWISQRALDVGARLPASSTSGDATWPACAAR